MKAHSIIRNGSRPKIPFVLICLYAVFSLTCSIALQSIGKTNSVEGLNLIPTPQEVIFSRKIGFDIKNPVSVSGDTKLAETVRDVLTENGQDSILSDSKGDIRVGRPIKPDEDIWQHDQAYILKIEATGISIEAADKTAAFYAAQTLAQLIANCDTIPALLIRDWPAIKTRLVMIATDQGGFQVIDVKYWKRIIRELSSVKINAIMPYFDGGTYKYRKYPFLGTKGDKGFTMEKAKILSEYASRHFVQLIPQQNSLGHLGGVLGHKELRHLRDGGGTINMVKPETLNFLGDLYDELAEAFPNSPAIHVGGDEFGHGFGLQPEVAARIEKIGKSALYAEFMTKLQDMLKKRNRSMMIWWNEQGLTIKAGDKMPKDIAVFDWHYNARQDYPSLDKLLKAGFNAPWATPAVTRYYYNGNDWKGTFANIHNFAVAGTKRGVPGICTCTWVHGMWGGRNIFELNLYGLVYSAECGWNPSKEIRAEVFAKQFAAQWLGCRHTNADKWIMNAIHSPYGNSDEQKFWRNNRAMEPIASSPLSTLIEQVKESPEKEQDATTLLSFCNRASSAIDCLRENSSHNHQTLNYFMHDIRIHRLAANRILAASELMRWSSTLNIQKPQPDKELLRLDVNGSEKTTTGPVITDASARPENDALITAPSDNWKRQGVDIGPTVFPETGIILTYDMRPLRFGPQFQQLASTKPSTHHYMIFIGPDRRFHLYTRSENNWAQQSIISSACETGRWYHCSVIIQKTSISFKVTDKKTGKTICRSGIAPMDNIGKKLVLNLSDCHAEAKQHLPATAWKNIVVSSLVKIKKQKITPPAKIISELNQLVDNHRIVEENFRRSVREAGGGSADTGNLSRGGVRFNSRQGRESIEHLIHDLSSGRIPASFCEQ